jgi:hypothetical protein
VLSAVADLFGAGFDTAAVAAGPAFTRHSKFGNAFDAEARAAERAAGEAGFAEEIDKVAQWTEAVALAAGVPMRLDAPLLG